MFLSCLLLCYAYVCVGANGIVSGMPSQYRYERHIAPGATMFAPPYIGAGATTLDCADVGDEAPSHSAGYEWGFVHIYPQWLIPWALGMYMEMCTVHTPIGSIGGWEGLPIEQVCASLTPGSSIETWRSLPSDCDHIVTQRVVGFVRAVEMTVVVLMMVIGIRGAIFGWVPMVMKSAPMFCVATLRMLWRLVAACALQTPRIVSATAHLFRVWCGSRQPPVTDDLTSNSTGTGSATVGVVTVDTKTNM